MRKGLMGAVLAAGLTGCAGYYPIKAQGIQQAIPDNPNVVVTSDVEAIRVGNVSGPSKIEYIPDPSLSVSFERALEKYIDAGTFKIISAETLPYGAFPAKRDLIIIVSSKTEIYQLKVTRDSSGIMDKFRDDLPLYLDDCARQLAEKLKAA